MSVLKLLGVVSHFNGGHLYIGGHHPSCDKVRNLGLCAPSNKFYVTMPYSLDSIECINTNGSEFSFDSEKIAGKKVMVWVRPKKYCFRSKYEHNRGQLISGTSLILFKLKILNSY